MKYLSLVILSSVLFGCASVNSVSLTSIPTERNKVVKAERNKTIFLGFNFDNDFLDTIVEDLKAQCPNGTVTGLLTKDENINYFLYIVWKKQITATGYCVASKTKTKSHKPKNNNDDKKENNNNDDEETES